MAEKTERRVKEKPTMTEMDRAMHELAEVAVRFPFRWFSQGKVARLCGFGDDVMTVLIANGAPIVGRKCNPHLLHKWLEENIDKLGKIRG